MKFSRILAIIFFVSIYSLNAYSYGLHFIKPQDKPLADTQEIMITGHHPNGTLDLKDASGNDASTLTVDSDDDIIWTTTDPDITIVNIKEKFLKGNHFRNKPHSQSSKKWQGKVDSYTDNVIHTSTYLIKWKDSNGKHKYDPLIKINPRQPIE